MSQADELLDSLTEDQVAINSVDSSIEPHVIINDDRTVTVPGKLKHIAVEGEHNVETLTFDCPRYWDGHDLSTMRMQINYQRPDGHREPCPVENLRVDDADNNQIHFDWTISGNVTEVKGNISFMVCAKIADDEGIVDHEWHSRLNQDLVIDEGLDCSGDEIIERNPDILESILARLDLLESTGGGTGGSGIDGKDGGYYTPKVSQPTATTMNVEFISSKSDMPAIDPVAINLPVGSDSDQNVNGLSAAEKNLMLALFKAVPYTSDVGATMKSLEAIWNSGSGGETPDIPDVTNYTITYNLTSVTADNTPASVVSGGSLFVNLTPDTNAVLGEVAVTMGGVDVTASAYSNSKISISSVTGDVVITATATVANYTQVEYLEAADNAAYIVTGYTLKSTDLVECEWAGPGSTNWAFPFSGCTKGGAMCKLVTRPDDTAGRTAYTRRGGGAFTVSNDSDPNFVVPKGNTTFLKFAESAPGTGSIYDTQGNVLCTLADNSIETFPDAGCVMGLFIPIVDGKNHGVNTTGSMRIKYFRIKNAYGDTVLDLIPVLDENNVACMYDKVSGEYLYNASTTEGSAFTAGGAV